MMDNGSIGDASSGATTRANADTSALFILMFDNITDTYAPLFTSGGFSDLRSSYANAAAAFAAHTRITMPKQLGRMLTIAGDGSPDGLGVNVLGQWDFEGTSGGDLGRAFWNIMIKL